MDSLSIRIPIESHHFYDFSPYHIIAFQPIKARRRLELVPMEVNCMFHIYKMERRGKFLGLAFRSASTVVNAGVYLMTCMNKRRNTATESTVLMRTSDIVIYNYPNVGTMAISPKLNPQMATLLEEQ